MTLRLISAITRQVRTIRQPHSCKTWRILTQSYSTDKDDDKNDQQSMDYRKEDVVKKVFRIIKQEVSEIKNLEMNAQVNKRADYLIIGGGLVGSAVAYWMKQREPKGVDITIIERDYGYTRASSMLSVGGIRHQFTLPENVQMSMFTSEFLRNIREHLSILEDDNDPPDVQFNHQGYLFLVPPNKAEDLSDCVKMQRELGAKIDLLSKDKLAALFPWLNLQGIEAGSYGLEGEGWFDPWLLLRALKKKNENMGVNYVSGEVIGFDKRIEGHDDKKHETLQAVDFKDPKGNIHQLTFLACINCAGPWAGEISKMVEPNPENVSTGGSVSIMPLPVEPRKRFVYVVHCPDGPPMSAPLTVDPTGAYFRREGFSGHYLCGASPDINNEPDISNLDVDYDFFNNKVWPDISYRVPAFEKLKLKSAWAGYYDFNYIDQNLVIGRHPYHANFFYANGMSGHGVQQSIAIGRAMSELIMTNKYQTIDLTRFGFERFILDEPLYERAIV